VNSTIAMAQSTKRTVQVRSRTSLSSPVSSRLRITLPRNPHTLDALAPLLQRRATGIYVIGLVPDFMPYHCRHCGPVNPSLTALRHEPSPCAMKIDATMPPSVFPLMNAKPSPIPHETLR
jgi:hypothetical protein